MSRASERDLQVHLASESEGSDHDSSCEKHLGEARESAQVENCWLRVLSLVACFSLVEGVGGISDFELLKDSMACSLGDLECSRPLPDDCAIFALASGLTILGVDQVVVRGGCCQARHAVFVCVDFAVVVESSRGES